MKHLLTLLGVYLFTQLAHAGPNINIGTVYDYLDGDKSTYLKRVFNAGDSTAFVKVNILEIRYDADGKMHEEPLQASADGKSRDGLMASPARLIVAANGMQGTRLLYMGERDRERYFRVRFVPVVPEQEDEFVVTSEEREQYKKSLSAGVSVLTGYGAVFFVRPKDTRYASVIENSTATYGIRNDGNTVTIIDEFQDCSVKSEQGCQPTTVHHILPGRSFKFEKKAGREYRFTLVEGERSQKLDVKG
jgi:P pilus assembly chaperone PapD